MTTEPGAQRGQAEGERLVLLAERDCHARELEACFLREAGFAIAFAADGAAAWEKARQLQPALLVTEVLLPRLDGLALCRQVKGAPETRHVPVLVVSVLAATARAREAGADGFLLKPLSQQRLLEVVTRLVPLPRASRQERA